MLHRKCRILSSAVAAIAAFSLPSIVDAEEFGGVEFPNGVSSFADSVIQYNCEFGDGQCPVSLFQDATLALGSPDLADPFDHFVSLGTFGLVELSFVDNRLTNSGDIANDLHIFELGADVEQTAVAIRPTPATATLLGSSGAFDVNSDGFYEVGSVSGGTASLDIDSFFPDFAGGQLSFDAVQLVDIAGELGTSRGTHGADINAVGAITSIRVGDFDFDTDVDGDDIDFYSGALGQPATGEFEQLDLDFDGMVTLSDHDFHVTTLVETTNGRGTMIGDINLDGDVDATEIVFGSGGIENVGDASLLLANLGTTAGALWGDGDLNADGDVDVTEIVFGSDGVQNVGDASRLLANLGQSTASTLAASTVPEPGSLALLAMTSIAGLIRRRK